jgi:hypothetical protein
VKIGAGIIIRPRRKTLVNKQRKEMSSHSQDNVAPPARMVSPRPHLAELDCESSRSDRSYAVPAALGLCCVANNILQPRCLVFVGSRVGGRGSAGLGLGGREALVEEARVLRGNLGAIFVCCL